MPLWTPGILALQRLGCTPYPSTTPDLSGKIVLVTLGGCGIDVKAQNALDFGAEHVLLHSHFGGVENLTLAFPGFRGIGMVTIDQGDTFLDLLADGSEVVVTMGNPGQNETLLDFSSNPDAGFPYSANSWGPSLDMKVKPEFSTPGSLIVSTYPVAKGGFAILSGTSMATPLASAIYALAGQARSPFEPRTLRSVVMSTAKATGYTDGVLVRQGLAPVPQQGAGLAQAFDAAHVQTLLNPTSLSFNDTDNFVDNLSFTISNTGSDEVVFNLGNSGALTAHTFDDNSLPVPVRMPLRVTDEYATLKFSSDSVTVLGGGGEVEVSVTVTPPAVEARHLPVYSGYITLNGTNGENLVLPYVGAVRSIRSATVLSDLSGVALGSIEEPPPKAADGMTFLLPPRGEKQKDFSVIPMTFFRMAFASPLVICERALESRPGQLKQDLPGHDRRLPRGIRAARLGHRQLYRLDGRQRYVCRARGVLVPVQGAQGIW